MREYDDLVDSLRAQVVDDRLDDGCERLHVFRIARRDDHVPW